MKCSASRPLRRALAAVALVALAAGGSAGAATCTPFATGLQGPIGLVMTPHGRTLVAESGTGFNDARISILESNGARRTLLAGLPSGPNDVGGVSGPTGMLLRGRTLYVIISVGDVGINGGLPGSAVPNPAGPKSPLFSSVLAIHLSAEVERSTAGFTMTPVDQNLLAAGQKITLGQGSDRLTIERVVDFPNYIPFPHPVVANNIKMSNPFSLALVGDQMFVTDGGRNLLWRVDLATGQFTAHATFPSIPNTTGVGGPVIEAVPTGIATYGDQLLVTLFRGAPFPPGVSSIQKIDPVSGAVTQLMGGLKTAIDVLPITTRSRNDLLVMEHATVGFFFGGPGQVRTFPQPSGTPVPLANCLTLPVQMVLDERNDRLLVTEEGGRVVAISPAP